MVYTREHQFKMTIETTYVKPELWEQPPEEAPCLDWLIKKTSTTPGLVSLRILQFIEVGLIAWLPDQPNLLHFDHNNNQAKGRRKLPHGCICCSFDSPIWHHVWQNTTKGKTATNGDNNRTDRNYIGATRVCPNCHLLIHQKNPFTLKEQPDLYEDINNSRLD